MEKITIFTPTYNRAYILTNAYKSLVNQNSKDFVWLIVDDGSTDDTKILVNNWIKEDKIKIKYINVENAGKASAFNTAIKHVETEYFLFSLDSDDIIVENGIKVMKEYIEKYSDYNGIVFLNKVSNQKKGIIYDKEVLKNKSFFDVLNDKMISTETVTLFKTEYIKKFSFPICEGEKFFTEGYIFYQMTEPMIWSDFILENATYLNDGLTNNTIKLFVKYPNSWYLYNMLRLEKSNKMKFCIKYTIYLISFGILSKRKAIIKNSKYKFLTIIMFPIGIIGALYLKLKAKRI